ncbi:MULTISPECIES: flagellin [unclassified Anaerobiospirillum]|uniref:flagellin N-terminal helical domain-containing protein n=1 Tax=unclassified Anaerobiospirillum TaxID=2647410 RepID=UPI001FF5FC3B|nr:MULTISPECIES: flagellin [unclassified Anaerobiospirillum]MCK0533669.1 flagellin [Anaerobiospirillum sp. NML120511]MCK0539632.1 flagellin [Anaerobiospirillum sp. NML02-A-032]
MAIYVNTNVSSLQGRNQLNNVQNSLNTTYQRLSSGLRINSAKDDAAGLQISSRLTTQINGLNQANRNASDGIALAQTVEGAMDEISGMLQKIRTLAVQSVNGTNTAEDRNALKKESDALAAEIQRVAEKTTFGGKTVLFGDGTGSIYGAAQAATAGKMILQVGANSGDTITFNVNTFSIGKFTERANGGQVDAKFFDQKQFQIQTVEGANGTIDLVDKMLGVIEGDRANLGALQNRLESSIRNQANVSANQADARSRIRDADFAEESSNLTQQSIIQQAATSMLMQSNTRPQLALSMLG